jgi:hypothetical protein
MTAEGTFPKVAGDIAYASEANTFRSLFTEKSNILGSVYNVASGTAYQSIGSVISVMSGIVYPLYCQGYVSARTNTPPGIAMSYKVSMKEANATTYSDITTFTYDGGALGSSTAFQLLTGSYTNLTNLGSISKLINPGSLITQFYVQTGSAFQVSGATIKLGVLQNAYTS